MAKEYIEPEIEIIELADDVVRASNEGDGDNHGEPFIS